MSTTESGPTQPQPPPGERFRLYVDESGDHVFNKLDQPSHRFLCLLGVWFRGTDYLSFHHDLESFKQRHFPHSPDEPLVLHREDIVSRRSHFWRLRDPERHAAFDEDLLSLIKGAEFTQVAVVIDKLRLREAYPTPAHPYHLAMGFLLQRYCGYLNHVSRQGDVMAESRGGREDGLLKDSYSRVFERGAWMFRADVFQRALTSRQLKLKPKSANVAGLQLADLLVKPIKNMVLAEQGKSMAQASTFEERLVQIARPKLNHHLYDGRVEGYGTVFFPK
jgi:hypothetical protein